MKQVHGLTALKTVGELAAFVSARLASGLLGLAGAGLFRLLISCCMEGQSSQQQSLAKEAAIKAILLPPTLAVKVFKARLGGTGIFEPGAESIETSSEV